MTDLPALRQTWTTLYTQHLPSLARSHSPTQPTWPVHLDHCFARIILDHVIGEDVEPWTKRLKGPAVKNMSEEQLQKVIEVGEKIASGELNLVELDQRSLASRGKREGKYGKKAIPDTMDAVTGKKRRAETDADIAAPSTKKPKPTPPPRKRQSTLSFAPSPTKSPRKPSLPQSPPTTTSTPNPILTKISTHPSLTPYRKTLYTTLLSIPAGHYTTYSALATHLHSSARAVGNGLRNNPFAPEVPCHRVLASDGSIGGFGGEWGDEGKHAGEKRRLLRREGVRFDGRGRVVGGGWRGVGGLGKGDG